jgi:hypothetical protein
MEKRNSGATKALPDLAQGALAVFDLERLDLEAESAYWLRFLNGRWLVYWHERLIGDFPTESAHLALAFLRQKQSEQPAWCQDARSGTQV